MPRVLIVDDDRAMREMLEAALSDLGFRTEVHARATEALEHLTDEDPQVVLTDVRMPGMSGIELCEEVSRRHPTVPVLVLTGFGSMETAVKAMRAGAYDFLSKPVALDELEFAVRRASEYARLTHEVRHLRERIDAAAPSGMIGRSAAFRRVLDVLPKAARSDVSVLIEGETGTGKELLARALHDQSPRAGAPFVAVNCSAIPENLVESELFGHVRGAFTDAKRDRTGLFLRAGEGTLFLDEIGELLPSVQPKLLRVLQEQRVRPVGADGEVPTRCRVIAATNVDLLHGGGGGGFRPDLFYRLAVIRIEMPRLADRGTDVLLLARHFIDRASARMDREAPALPASTAQVLLGYAWPGNVRELENAMERAVAMTDGAEIAPTDLPPEILQAHAGAGEDHGMVTLAELERRHIQRVLEATDGNKKAAAEILGLDRRTLYRKLDRLP